jgi:glutamate-5-semialdehyde dehydrogenase
MNELEIQLQKVKSASQVLAVATTKQRNSVLAGIAKALDTNRQQILAANKKDLALYNGEAVMADRLTLTDQRITDLIAGVKKVKNQTDPLGHILSTSKMANGLIIDKVTVPLGVIGVIYESRPNVTVDLAVLCLKSGNAAVLKGGKESWYTNQVLVALIQQVLRKHKLPASSIYSVNPKEQWKEIIFNAHGLIDVLIPRGGQALIKAVRESARIPVIETGAGVCHILVDQKYNIDKAVNIIVNAKTQRPSVCNALDTLVVHEKIAEKLLSRLAKALFSYNVVIQADGKSFRHLKQSYSQELLQRATHSSYGHEFLSLQLAIKTVKSFAEGLKFVKTHTSGHTEAILTDDDNHASQFLNEVDAAVVIKNASTRFTDGGEFGLGAEVGISTQKLHARGPMGAEALTSYKWVVKGSGQVRA